MNANTTTKYDPNAIIMAAEARQAQNDIAGAQLVYKSALLEWGDDAREGATLDPEQMKEAIATLWLAYANLNRSVNLFKTATEAYEGAATDPVAGSSGRVWLEYARFQEERGRHRSAQNVYLRALVGDGDGTAAVTDEQDQALLWNEFLSMMRKLNKNPNLTMDELMTAVQREHVVVASVPQQKAASSENNNNGPTDAPPAKRPRVGGEATTIMPSATLIAFQPVTAEMVEAESTAFLGAVQSLPPEVAAAWIARDGNAPPSRPYPPLFAPSPPKLADSSGKDILGEQLALTLIRRLLQNKSDDDGNDGDHSGSILLEVCRGCWMMTALKEIESSRALERFDKKLTADNDAMESNLDARLSVAGNSAAQINENERRAFLSSCARGRQQLLSTIAWEFRQLLCIQQQLLTRTSVPGFEGPTVEATALDLQSRVCSFLHSAFFLRARVGEYAHNKMLGKLEARLAKQVSATASASGQQQVSDARRTPPPPRMPPQFQQQPQMYMQHPPPPPMGFPPPPGQIMPQAPYYAQPQPAQGAYAPNIYGTGTGMAMGPPPPQAPSMPQGMPPPPPANQQHPFGQHNYYTH